MRGRGLGVLGIMVAGVALQACGSGGGASSPTAPAAPAPAATPAAVAAPSPTPTPTPTATPEPDASAPGAPNLRPVARVVIKIEFIDCPTGELNLHGPFNWTSVGCRIHMDMTPRDKYNKPTEGAKGDPDWILNDPSLVYFRPATYTPVLRAEKAGKLIIQGELDGIKSNLIEIHLY